MICTICGAEYVLGKKPRKRTTCGAQKCQNRWTWLAKLDEYRQKKLAQYHQDQKTRPGYRQEINRKAKAMQRYGVESREIILQRFNHKCVNCGSVKNLAVHHLDNRGRKVEGKQKPNNSPDNLVVVCAGCHVRHHAYGHAIQVKV